MKYPTPSELMKYIDKDFQDFVKDGLAPKEALSRVVYEYEYLANKSDEFKRIIYTYVYEIGLHHGFQYLKAQDELNKLKTDSNESNPKKTKQPPKKLEVDDEKPFTTLATFR